MAGRGDMAGRRKEEFDIMAEDSTWGKALARYRKKGMSEEDIDAYRQAFAERQRAGVKSLASRSAKRK